MYAKYFLENNDRTRIMHLKTLAGNYIDHINATAKQSYFNYTVLTSFFFSFYLKVLSKIMKLEGILLHLSQLLIQPETLFFFLPDGNAVEGKTSFNLSPLL